MGELGRAGAGGAVATAPDYLGKGRQIWLLPRECWAAAAATPGLAFCCRHQRQQAPAILLRLPLSLTSCALMQEAIEGGQAA